MMWKDIGIGVLFGLFFAFQLVLFFFAFYPPATSLVDQSLISYSKDVVGPIFTGLGGAMLGAFAAYAFQKNSEATREFNDSLRVLRVVKFQLIHKLSELVSVKKNSLLAFDENQFRFLAIGPLPESPGIHDFVDNKILDLLANEKAAKAIESILLGDQRYFACFSNFKQRNKALEGYREVVSAAGLNAEMNCTFQQVVRAVEPGRLLALYGISELSITVVDEAIQTLDMALTEIGSALDKKFSIKGASSFTYEKIDPALFNSLKAPYFSFDELEALVDRIRQGRE